MFTKILVGTDGSETAAAAVSLAADLAKHHNAVLHIVNAYQVPAGGVAVVSAGAMAVADSAVRTEVLRTASDHILGDASQQALDLKTWGF